MNSAEFRSCGFFPTAKAALRALPKLSAQVFVIEMQLQDMCGIACARQMVEARPELRTILLASSWEPSLVYRARQAGISECLALPLYSEQLVLTLQFLAGQPIRKAGPARSAIPHRGSAGAGAAHPVLSPREQEVISHLARGMLYKEIGDSRTPDIAVTQNVRFLPQDASLIA